MISLTKKRGDTILLTVLLTFFTILVLTPAMAANQDGEKLYNRLALISRGEGDLSLFNRLNEKSRKLNWEKAETREFTGNLRILKPKDTDEPRLIMIRELKGEILILSVPDDPAMLNENADSPYAGLAEKVEDKLEFKIEMMTGTVDGEVYEFARLLEEPTQVPMDKIFKISIILMLFFVMVGMGLTLTVKDFALVFSKPKGIILGEILQFVFMPLIAFAIGHLLGYYEHYPFIFVGMILIMAIPGGVTSNLMTYFAKGDLALSISMTSFSTILSLFFTPFLLSIYCSNVPKVSIPVMIVVQTIIILVIVPVFTGMAVRAKWEKFAEKATPFFSILGVIALLFIIIFGVLSNLHVFADVERYGVKFYSMVFGLTILGMFFGALLPKLFRVNNYQSRAISLESGLRNASLAMAIAILLKDRMGDFYSSMFVVSGIFGLVMYIAGFFSIYLYKYLLPVEELPEEEKIPLDSEGEQY